MSAASVLKNAACGVVSPESSFTDTEKPLSPFAAIMAWVAIAWVVGFSILLPLITGCSTGYKVVLRDATSSNLGSIELEESTWPIVSYVTGPTFTFWVKEDQTGTIFVNGSASMTNTTSALGIYDSTESKYLFVDVAFTNAPTATAAEVAE